MRKKRVWEKRERDLRESCERERERVLCCFRCFRETSSSHYYHNHVKNRMGKGKLREHLRHNSETEIAANIVRTTTAQTLLARSSKFNSIKERVGFYDTR